MTIATGNHDKSINVLVVDDSSVSRMVMQEILEQAPGVRVIGSVASGEEALRFMAQHPREVDVITMDVIMPGLNGFETTRRIMETQPVPIVIITSSFLPGELTKTFQVVEAGAVTILKKPVGASHPGFETEVNEIRDTVVAMSQVKVVKRWARVETKKGFPETVTPEKWISNATQDYRSLVMGASTGGPQAIQYVLSKLSHNIPVPILVVQHIGGEFVGGMADWLAQSTGFPVQVASQGMLCLPGHVYLAPSDIHMGITRENHIWLNASPPENGCRPSASYLFRSAAQVYGKGCIGVLLTGMGQDGADGLKEMRNAGAVTIAQDEKSSLVFGMPGVAVEMDAALHILPLAEIPTALCRYFNENKE